MTGPTVLTALADGIATVTLNRPERLNAINQPLVEELHATLDRTLRDPGVHAVILTGAGDRAFCAGDDLNETADIDPEIVRAHLEQVQDITRLIVYGEKPVIAAVNGWAVGGGLEWVVDCDFSIWADTARGFFPEVALGLGVTGAVTSLLPRMIGWQRTRTFLFLGDKHPASTFLELGIAHAVVPPDRVLPEARRLAERLVALPRAALGGLKRALAAVHRDELERAMAAEAELLARLLTDPETRRRMAAFGTG